MKIKDSRNKRIQKIILATGIMLWIGGIANCMNGKGDDAKKSDDTSSGTATSCALSAFCSTFIATNGGAKYNGNLGGVSGADAKCTAAKPAALTGTYKALIVATGVREALTKISWVLYASKQYRRQNGTTVTFTTDVNRLVTENPTSATVDPAGAGSGLMIWTGLEFHTWAVNTSAPGLANCGGNWSSNAAGDGGGIGLGDHTDNDAFTAGGTNCNQTLALLCVQQ